MIIVNIPRRSVRDVEQQADEKQSTEEVERGQRHDLPVYWEKILEVLRESLSSLQTRMN